MTVLAKRARLAPRAAAALLGGELLDPMGHEHEPLMDCEVAADALSVAMGDDPASLWSLAGKGPRDDDSPVARIARRLVETGGAKRRVVPHSRRAMGKLRRREVAPDPRLVSRKALAALRAILARDAASMFSWVLDERLLEKRHGLTFDDFDAVGSLVDRLSPKQLGEIVSSDPETLAVAVQQLRFDAGFQAYRDVLDELAKHVRGTELERALDFVSMHQEGAH